jgi:hypothetical protein
MSVGTSDQGDGGSVMIAAGSSSSSKGAGGDISISTGVGVSTGSGNLALQSSDVIMNVSIHEDNLGALVLAETLPPQFMPRSKYYATKTIWF